MHLVYRILLALTGAVSCTTSHLPTVVLTPTQPSAPLTTADTLLAVALRRVALHGLPDFGPRKQAIIVAKDGYPSTSGIPTIDSITFVLLDSMQIQRVVDSTGDLNVLWASTPTILGDSAVVNIGNYWVRQRRPRKIGLMTSFSVCSWHLHRMSGAWQLDTLSLCLVT